VTQTDSSNRVVTFRDALDFNYWLNDVHIDATGTGTMTVAQTQGHLGATGFLLIGEAGTGHVEVSDGYLDSSTSYATILGKQTGSVGTILLSGSGTARLPVLHIGESGTGTFTQTGGAFDLQNFQTHDFYLGYNAGGHGTYNLSGG